MDKKHIKKNKMPGMISCDEATFLISKKQDAHLNWSEKLQLKMHLMFCKFCKRYDRQIGLIDRTIKTVQMKTKKRLSLKEKEKIHQRIMEEENLEQ